MRKHISLVFVLSISAFCILLGFLQSNGGYLSFIDARTYLRAFSAWSSGSNPYQVTNSLNFVYPPVFPYVYTLAVRFLTIRGVQTLYVIFHIFSALIIPWIIYRYYIRQSRWSLEIFYALYVLAPGLAFFLSLDTGNIAIMAYAAMLLAGALGLEKDRWLPFYVMVLVCASIKITYVPMLLLPLLCATSRQLLPSLTCAGLASLGLQLQGWLHPALFRGFKESLSYQTVVLGDFGAGIFGISYHVLNKLHHTNLLLPMVAYLLVAFSCVSVASLVRLKDRMKRVPSWPAIVLLVIFFAVPRVEYYDLCFGCPIAILLVARDQRTLVSLLVYLAIFLPALYFRLRMPYTALDGGFQAVASLVLLTLLLIRAYKSLTNESKLADIDAYSLRTPA